MRRNPSIPNSPTWAGTLDYTAAIGTIVVFVSAILLILNGRCSQPNGFRAGAPVCVGSHLSVQSWLAIIGVEFSLLGTFLLPRLASLTISKGLTHKMAHSGLPAGRLLNSFSNAPLAAQVHGVKTILLFRILIVAMVAAASVLYKFSFVQVDASGSLVLPSSANEYEDEYIETNSDYTNIGVSDVPRLGLSSVPGNVLSANLVDYLAVTNASVILVASGTGAFPDDGQTDMIVGPKVNATRLTEIVNGSLHSCDALFYMRATYYSSRLFFNTNWNEFPNATETPTPDEVRITTVNWNETDHTNIATGSFMDIKSLSNGSLQAWSADNSAFQPGWTARLSHKYQYRITVNMQYCYGYVTWDNQDSGAYRINNPSDLACQSLPFDVVAWNKTWYAAQAKGFVQATVAGRFYSDFWTRALPVVSIILPHDDARHNYKPSLPRNPVCAGAATRSRFQDFAVAEGVIRQARTGATGVGVSLQIAVAVVAAVMAAVLAWPAMPLVTEWPAQWLALSAAGLDQPGFLDVAAGRAVAGGGARVRSHLVLRLTGTLAGESGLALSVDRPLP
ncbi:hypothetical protein VFPBJ_05128 [Purpureocillium lilacinum]|uniref:Uncharacterized protein n=1 Tax=Purpureocillium lilacinum TaxID=33203 RepID=A0A179GZ23_PURLI|nr:hypothetical protein VFPBJ_05128 [Purpureocillium lilacinum]